MTGFGIKPIPPVGAADFFTFARERHAVYLRRQAGQAWPWTEDPVLRQYSFCNLFRELDKTTKWFAKNVREPLRDKPEVLLATVLFRWFNRIEVGEAIFLQGNLLGLDAWGTFLETGNIDFIKNAILSYVGPKGPYVTGAYTIVGKTGLPKLDGVLWCVDNFARNNFPGFICDNINWRDAAQIMLDAGGTLSLEHIWRWFRQVPYLGDFMAYEIVTDLRHTALLEHAPDIDTWANPGPGAARGLARVYVREIYGNVTRGPLPSKTEMIFEMRELLALSRLPEYWPQPHPDKKTYRWRYDHDILPSQPRSGDPLLDEGSWPAWEMREVEHWLCEFQKYRKAQLGEGRPRGVYRHA